MWLFEGKEFDSSDSRIESLAGFVYCITDLTNGKKYIGKKTLWSTRKLKPLKGKTRRRVKKTQSDWMSYYGSNEEVKLLIESNGSDKFKREILKLCKTKGLMSYYEAKEQFDREVLFSDQYYNEFIGCKIHSKHIKGKE